MREVDFNENGIFLKASQPVDLKPLLRAESLFRIIDEQQVQIKLMRERIAELEAREHIDELAGFPSDQKVAEEAIRRIQYLSRSKGADVVVEALSTACESGPKVGVLQFFLDVHAKLMRRQDVMRKLKHAGWLTGRPWEREFK
jgi:hypothetical protein